MLGFNVVIFGENDWAHYYLDIDTVKNVANNLKTIDTQTLVAELGNILNTNKKVHNNKENDDFTVPNILAAFIYRTELFSEIVQQTHHAFIVSVLLGCFKTQTADGKQGYHIRNGGLFFGNINDEKELMSIFWRRVYKFQAIWLEDGYHPEGTFHKMLKQIADALA